MGGSPRSRFVGRGHRVRHASTLEITLADRGIASAYSVLPLGTFKREVERLHKALRAHDIKRRKRKTREQKTRDPKVPRNISLKEVVYAFGHADLLAYFQITDVR